MVDLRCLRLSVSDPTLARFLQVGALSAISPAFPALPDAHLLGNARAFTRSAVLDALYNAPSSPAALLDLALRLKEHRWLDAVDLEQASTALTHWVSPSNTSVFAEPTGVTALRSKLSAPALELIEPFCASRNRFVLPRLAALAWLETQSTAGLFDLSELFNTQEEAETTFSLWSPGSADWGSFQAARASAKALA